MTGNTGLRDLPLYAKIAGKLRAQITDGTYGPGALLPSRNELAGVLPTHPGTGLVPELAYLHLTGLLVSGQRLGWRSSRDRHRRAVQVLAQQADLGRAAGN